MDNDEKTILLGATGSVAAYKIPDLVREIKNEGIIVKVIMTDSSMLFVTPLSLEISSQNPVFSDVFESPFTHIDITKDADALLVAPATANTISKFASGIADNLLTISFMSFNGPKVLVPAMNWRMYENPVFQDKLNYLKDKGVIEIPPESGHLACGEEGIGRMADIETIKNVVKMVVTKHDLKGMKVVVSAGPTREYIDPVRFISNRSSGKMGYSLAKTAFYRGAKVILISGPSCLNTLKEVEFIPVESFKEMEEAIISKTPEADILIMTAAVADFMPEKKLSEKIQRNDNMSLSLLKTNDILFSVASMKKRPFIVGFSAEIGNEIDRARRKLTKKGIDMIVFNDLTAEGAGFDSDTNIVTILSKDSDYPLPKMSKDEVANNVYDKVLEMMAI